VAIAVTSVLDVQSLDVLRGSRPVVSDVSFSAARGEVVALMGASGGGKTTILRAIAGLDPLSGGSVTIDGVTLTPGPIPRGQALREVHRRVGIVFQFHHLFAHLTAAENVWLAPVHVLHRPRPEAQARAHELLRMLGVDARGAARPHELSGGEAQRVAIARALAVDPPLLLMDEPTASLDAGRRDELAATVRELAAQQRTIVMATHDAGFAQSCAHRVVTIENGRLRTVF
jgi:ABC-type polar amino acid transport system ATPase subunit